MRKFHWLAFGLAVAFLAFSVPLTFAEKVQVSVLYRQDSDAIYRAIVPGYSGPDADVSGACLLDPDPANCPDSSQTGPANYILAGATLSLGLPDGRIAVVNCVNRYSAKGNYINRRSCGVPLVERVEAEFTGKKARLTWRVGPDGKKTESETYKVIALLAKPTESARISTGDQPGSR